MNVKLFQTRLDERHIQADQQILNDFMAIHEVKKTATQFVIGQPDFWSILVFYEDKSKKTKTETVGITIDVELTEEDQQVFSALKQWRKDRANHFSVPEYLICHNAELLSITKARPTTIDQLSRVKGMGDQKIAKYGDDIIAIVNAFF